MAHYFLAIQIPEQLQAYYQVWQNELKDRFPYKRWTAKADFHITLSFLGEASDKQIQELRVKLEAILLPHVFPLTLGSLGFFGRRDRPRVLYVEVGLSNELNQLHKQINKVTEKVGFKSENRPYRPHLTLAKKWGNADSLPGEKIQELNNRFSTRKQFNVLEVTLYKIHPKKSPSYEVVAVFPLET